MRTRILLVAALAISLVVVPATTSYAAKRTRPLEASIRMAVIGQNPTTFAGELLGRPAGRSAIVLRSVASGNTATGRAVLYARGGTIKATTKNEIQPQPDGSVRFPGTFKIVDGTRRFRNATGSGTFDAVLPANSTVYEVTLSGKIRY
jgi:hypothetical protein